MRINALPEPPSAIDIGIRRGLHPDVAAPLERLGQQHLVVRDEGASHGEVAGRSHRSQPGGVGRYGSR